MGTASIIVGSFLFFGQTQAHAEEFERVTTGTVDTGGQPARADQGQEGPQAGADTHNTASQPGATGQDAPNENHAGDQNAAVTHPADQKIMHLKLVLVLLVLRIHHKLVVKIIVKIMQ